MRIFALFILVNFRFSVPDDVIQKPLTYPSCGVTSKMLKPKTSPKLEDSPHLYRILIAL